MLRAPSRRIMHFQSGDSNPVRHQRDNIHADDQYEHSVGCTSSDRTAQPRSKTRRTTTLAFFGVGGVLGISLLRRRIKKNLWYVQLGFVLMVLAAGAFAGCGGSGSSGPKTPKGTYQVTVSGAAGTTTHSATYGLTVQ